MIFTLWIVLISSLRRRVNTRLRLAGRRFLPGIPGLFVANSSHLYHSLLM